MTASVQFKITNIARYGDGHMMYYTKCIFNSTVYQKYFCSWAVYNQITGDLLQSGKTGIGVLGPGDPDYQSIAVRVPANTAIYLRVDLVDSVKMDLLVRSVYKIDNRLNKAANIWDTATTDTAAAQQTIMGATLVVDNGNITTTEPPIATTDSTSSTDPEVPSATATTMIYDTATIDANNNTTTSNNNTLPLGSPAPGTNTSSSILSGTGTFIGLGLGLIWLMRRGRKK